ncbi:N-acetylglucosamine kinase [Nonomuraea sp. NPDC050663]|uniref:N-acetylglucosamine kinase n=1 Tax=Nonomuraea sp. NPDC050663 TaxID=3364370 RepID=UPI003794CC89
MAVVIGVDAGGTSSRAVVATLDGHVVGRARAGCGNPAAVPASHAYSQLKAAIDGALAEVERESVVAATIGLAGIEAVTAELEALFPVRPQVVGDVVVALAAGTPEPSGTVLIAGTGAIAAKIIDHTIVSTADGFGWQLGDEGSAFWLGRQAARSAVRARPGLLTELVLKHLGAHDHEQVAVVAQAAPPLALAELAPLVSRACEEGDPAAAEIVERGAQLLARTFHEVHEPGTPAVLAGSVLTNDGPVRRAVRDLLAPSSPATAGPGELAAAWLAARTVSPAAPHRGFLPF